MSAKPQPMAGQSDTADDLIAELAKLMAQDAKSDEPDARPSTFPVRIPGGDNGTSAGPVPRFDFQRTIALAAEQPSTQSKPAGDAAATDNEPSLQPFDFNFVPTSKAPTAQPSGSPAAERTPDATAAMAAVSTVDHDSIADLIAAELSRDSAPAPDETDQAISAPASAGDEDVQDAPVRPALRALNLRPAPKAEQDRFAMPPVFGVGTRPAPVEPVVKPVAEQRPTATKAEPAPVLRQAAPPAEGTAPTARQDENFGGDPIDEIESLIGRAMSVEFDQPAETKAVERPAPSPALRSLATPSVSVAPPAVEPFAGQPSAPRSLSGADEAIFAAAQATGAEIGWVEPSESSAMPAAASVRARRAFALNRSVVGPLVAVTLLLAAGFGLYWVLGQGREAGPAPLLTADAGPIKETPAAEPEAAAAQQSVVFNEIDGVVPGAEEQLVSRDQADVNEVTQVPPAGELSEEGLANRKVRTVTVRPDGTIVSGEDSVAGSAILPVDRPNVPEVPGAETASPELLANAETQPVTPAATPEAGAGSVETPEAPIDPAATEVLAAVEESATTVTPAAPAATVTPVTPGSIVPAVDAAGAPIPGRSAPVPMVRPSDLAQVATPTAPASATASTGGNLLPPPPAASAFGSAPTAAAEAATAPAIPGAVEVEALPNSAPAYAQLASLRSEAEARQAAQALVTRFGPLFGGANMEVQRVDLGTRGVYYRVRVPAESSQAAGNICTNVIAAGGDCVLM